ncbi:hypothetical protein [Flavobacterium sp. LAR06]|uniref:hypothetical protein n=1 Tax=Flavobacterium sp. LAR06 TaxID=3064897 RepID=UPI0035BFD3DE
MIKKVLSPIIISAIQIIVVAIIHQSLNYFYPIQHRSVGFGLTVFLTGIIFMLCILAFNFYFDFFKRNNYWIGFFLLIITSILPFSAFNERPLRSLFLILLVLCGFLSSLALNKWRKKINMESKTRF